MIPKSLKILMSHIFALFYHANFSFSFWMHFHFRVLECFHIFFKSDFYEFFLIFINKLFSIFHKINNHLSMQRNDSFHQSRNLNLIDDSLLEDSIQHNSLHLPLQQNDAISTGSSEEIIPFDGDYNETSIINNLDSPLDCMSFQGCVRRKTVLKDGRKPTVASWQRYWLQIWANSLVYFPPKSFKG